ncbi:DUF433 domain-containing protein [Cyanobium sp. CH-040]|uniref:DUF433 domain-containing protein n=1 Tax=Cyanobium sp. CH-040 TaxID=2823708 RepID=UPI0020CB7006|nr:DUF433 domain-containing protein [Cyanobium sp. CH-040]MCP9926332.1 DUF433 domain-containing protein [Cyanobium sp. CH-040]
MTSQPSTLITCTPGVRSGKPCVAGTRITVSDVLEYLASGMSPDELLADFPDLQAKHIQAVLRYAADREKRLSALTVA